MQKLPDLIEAQTKKSLLDALAKTRGNVSKAAAPLGISRYTVHRLIRRFGLKREGGARYT
ncbi:MAG: helix-turn-helix domain-containing protein [Bradyrhizobium sp.]